MAVQPVLPALDLLLRQYWRLASDLVDVATPQDFVSRLSSDWRYERALQGMRLLVQHHIGLLVQNLMAWRQQVTDEIKKAYSTGSGGPGGGSSGVLNVQGICKRAAMEIIFLEASQVVLEEFRPAFFSDRLFCLFFDNMQQLAFRWLVKAEEYVPHPELTGLRNHLVANSVRLVAAMSRIRLPDITQQFLRKLDERLYPRKDTPGATAGGSPSSANAGPLGATALRAQLLKLCSGMRGVVLSFDSDQQLAASTDFLRQTHPLTHTASYKKSQVHHALCEMLADVLRPLVRSNLPAANAASLSPHLLQEWYAQVMRIKNDIGQWVNKHNKHINVGYPLVTLLVCLVEQEQYVKQMDIMAEFLVKQMKVKEYRSLCFRCLGQLVVSYLVRAAGPAAPSQAHAAWLDRIVKPALATARKGGLVSAQEQLEFVVELADLNPEYALGSVVLEMLQQADAPETQTTALRALQIMLTSVPASRATEALEAAGVPGADQAAATSAGRLRHSGGALPPHQQQPGRRMVQVSLPAVLQLIRSGRHPFDLQGVPFLLPKVQSSLAGLLSQCHRTFGSATSWSGEAVPKDKAPQAVLLGWLLRLLPLLKPESWPGQPLDLLPGYTAHMEGQLRVCALDALQAVVRSAPGLRGALLISVTKFLGSIPDEAVQATRECTLLLRNLMQLWINLMVDEGRGGSLGEIAAGLSASREGLALPLAGPEGGAQGSAAYELDLPRVEGALFVLLCSFDAALRRDALDGLAQLRALHQQLQQRREAAAAAAAAGGRGMAAAALESGEGPAGSRLPGRGAARHAPSASRDSIEFVRALGGLEAQSALPEATTYVVDVVEEVGADVARRCYWDFGDWSDVWRDARAVPADVTLEGLMSASDDVGCLRWARCSIDLARAAVAMCPASMGVAYSQALFKLQRNVTRDGSGRASLPLDPPEGHGVEAWRASLALPCVVPPGLGEPASGAAAARKASQGAGLTSQDVVRALLSALSVGAPPMHHQLYLLAVGHCSKEHYTLLAQELPALMEEYLRPSSSRQRARSAGRPEEARKLVANIFRAVADAAPPGAVAAHPQLAARLLEWLRETQAFLRGLPPFGEEFWEASQVAYCLCSAVRSLSGQLAPPPPPLAVPTPQLQGSADAAAANAGGALAATASSGPPQLSGPGSSKSVDLSPGSGGGGGGAIGGGLLSGCIERKLLWELVATWCQDGKAPEASEYASRLAAGMSQALGRLRDLDAEGREAVRVELLQCAEALDAAARGAMAALLQGPAFDADARRAQGPVLQWADRLLRSLPSAAAAPGAAGRLAALRQDPDGAGKGGGGSGGGGAGPPRAHVARLALGHLLRFNLDMFGVCVDRCYHPDPSIATGYFQVVSEVYALHAVPCEPHVVLSLVLYKMVDPGPEVREDALHMLHVLSTLEWQHGDGLPQGGAGAGSLAGAAGALQGQLSLEQLLEGWEDALRGGSSSVVVLGALQDSYQQFQYQLSAKLARDHPELSEQLCEEMMTRQLECADKVMQHPVLTCLAPWMENLSIAAHWKGTWCERLLKSMYYVTLRHGSELPLEIERLWSTLAANRRNITPVLDFLVSLGMHVAFQELPAVLEYFSVAQRICLYLARISPQQTIDHLVYEVSLGLHEDYAAAAAESFYIAAGASSARLDRVDSAGAFASVQRRQTGGRPAGPLEFSSLLAEPGPYPGSAGAVGQGSSQLLAPPGRLAASIDLRLSSSSAAWPPGAAGSTGTGTVGGSASSGALGRPSVQVQEDGSLASQPLAAQRSDSDTSRSSGAFAAGALGGGGGGGGGAAGGGGPADSVTSSGGWAAGLGLGLGLSGLGFSGLSLSQLGLGGLAGLSTLALGSLGASAGAGGLPPKGPSFGARVSRDAASVASWDDASSIGLPMPPSGGPPRGGGGSRGGAGGGGGGGASGGGAGPRGASGELMSPAIRALVTRPELALCLLTEVAYEHDEDFEGHLALLLHVVVLSMDSDEPLVVAAAQALLVNALYSLSARHIELRHAEGLPADVAQVTQLIQYLQPLRGRRLWPNEDPSLARPCPPSAAALSSLVDHLLGALAFEPGLRAEWCEVALEWALHSRGRHSASRSQQVLRTLAPPLTGDLCGALLRCILQCLDPASQSAVARETLLELVITLTALSRALPTGRLVLFPQVFWAAVALLGTDYVHVFHGAVELASVCASRLALHDATVQSVLLASAPVDADDGAAAAALAGAGDSASAGPRDAGALRRASSCDAAGGPDAPAGPLAPWAVGRLLPWLDDGGGAEPALALQQLLWKGLLFDDSRAATVRLMAQLAGLLSGLPSGASRGSSPSLSASGGALSTRAAGTPPRPGTPAGRGAAGAGAGAPQPRARGHHSRASSARSSGAGLPSVVPEGGGSRVPSLTPGSSAAGQGGLSSAPSPAGHAPPQPTQQQQSLPPLHEQPDGGGSGAATPVAQELYGVLSRSAPELGSLGMPAGAASATAAPGTGEGGEEVPREAPLAGGGGGVGGGGGGAELSLEQLQEVQQREREANFRTAPLPSRGRAPLPPAWPAGPGAPGTGAPLGPPRPGGGSPALKQQRRAPSVRRVYQALLGDRHAQLAVTAFALVPLACARLRAPAAGAAGGPAAAAAAAAELAGELRDALLALAAACGAQGLRELGARVEALAGARARDLPALLPRVASQLARAFCPAYAEWALRAAAGALLLPGAGALRGPVLELLRHVFDTPGLALGPAALGLLVADGGLLGPVVALSQGPMCQHALAALDAITNYVAACPEAAAVQQQQRQQQQQQQQLQSLATGANGGDGGGGAGAGGGGSEPLALVACVIPRLDVHAMLLRALDTSAAPAKKRKFKLLPFINGGAGGDASRRFTDEQM